MQTERTSGERERGLAGGSSPLPFPSEYRGRGEAGVVGVREYVVWSLFAGYLLFAHGCHGDEDNELFAALRTITSINRQ